MQEVTLMKKKRETTSEFVLTSSSVDKHEHFFGLFVENDAHRSDQIELLRIRGERSDVSTDRLRPEGDGIGTFLLVHRLVYLIFPLGDNDVSETIDRSLEQ